MADLLVVLSDFLACVGTGIMMATIIWFVGTNCLMPEEKHPLDFYSNVVRTKPYVFILLLISFLGSAGSIYATGSHGLFRNTVPELVVVVYTQGILIVLMVWREISAAGAWVSGMMYSVLSACMLVFLLSFDPPISETGWFYSVVFLLAHIFIVIWLRFAVNRHASLDQGNPLVPMGAERLTRAWQHVVFNQTPVLLASSSALYLLLYQLKLNRYGGAFAVTYGLIASVLLAGCCHGARDSPSTTGAVEAV